MANPFHQAKSQNATIRLGKKIATGIFVIIVVVIGIGFAADTIQPMPNHAKVIVDQDTKEFFAHPYFEHNKLPLPTKPAVITAREARDQGYEPNNDCREQGFFYQDTGAWIWSWAEAANLIKRQSRWNDDGTWNW